MFLQLVTKMFVNCPDLFQWTHFSHVCTMLQMDFCTSGLQHLTTLKQLSVLLSKSVLLESTGRLSNKKQINSVAYRHDSRISNLNKSSQVNDYSFYPVQFSWFFTIEIQQVISTKIMGNNNVLKLVKKGFKVFKTYLMHVHRHYSLFELIKFSTCFRVNTELRPQTLQELCLWFYINYTSAGSNQQAWYQAVETWRLWTCSSGN